MSDDAQVRLDVHLAKRITEKKSRLDQLRPLPPDVVARLHADTRVTFTYHSNAIEGNTLSLRETKLAIEDGITVGGHPLREYLEATNHAEAYQHLIDLVRLGTPITIETILLLHHVTMEKILAEPGKWRTVLVTIAEAAITPPSPSHIPQLMREWVAWIHGTGKEYHPIARVAIAHHGFEAVHPFVDGNGRLGRLLLNFILMQEGYPPATIQREWRGEYLAALSQADRGKYRALANLIGKAVEIGLDAYLAACTDMPEDPYKPLAELAPLVDMDPNYLTLLIRTKRLHAIKRGRRWYTTLDELERYQADAAHHPGGRPPKEPPSPSLPFLLY
jgi:Fic family protein